MRLDLLKTILWLRWKLSANQFARAGAWLRVVSVLITMGAGVLICVLAVGGFLLARTVLAKMEPNQLMLIIDGLMVGFLFFWGIGILGEIQRSESIDLQRLLHLPVKLKDAFIVNYLASHVSLSLLLITPAITGVSLGLIVAGRTGGVVLLPLFVAFVFAVSSWTYCLRGWLVQLMVNPRRRRSIIIAMTLAIIVLAQAPNLFFNVYFRRMNKEGDSADKRMTAERTEQAKAWLKTAHYYVPPLWVGLGTTKMLAGNWWPAGAAIILFSVAGGVGVSRAYRSTLKFYLGEDKAAPVIAAQKRAAGKPIRNTLEGELPFVGGDVSAAALAFWRSMVRAPEMKMALLGPFIMALVIVTMFYTRDLGGAVRIAGPVIAISATLFSMSGVLQIVFNLFGWDREGFRAIVLSPIDRGRLLFAKNMAVFPMLTGVGMILFVGLSVMMKLNPLIVVGGVFQIITATLILCLIGNYLSITLPHRIQVGSLKPTKIPVKNVVVMLVFTLLFPVYLLPALVGPIIGSLMTWAGSSLGVWINIGVSGVMCLVSVALYALSNRPLGKLLQNHERNILEIVTSELE